MPILQTRLNPMFWILLAALGAAGIGFAYDRGAAPPTSIKKKMLIEEQRDPAPDFSFTDMNGASHSLQDFRGQTVILHFWATWCAPCLVELPDLVHTIAARKDMVLIALSSDLSVDTVKKFLHKNPRLRGKNIFIAHDPGRAVTARLYGTQIYPETILIDQNGAMRTKWAGPQSWSTLDFAPFLTP